VITIRVELDDENKGRIPVVVFHHRQLNKKREKSTGVRRLRMFIFR